MQDRKKLTTAQRAVLLAARHAWYMERALVRRDGETVWESEQRAYWRGKRAAYLEALYLFRGVSR